MCRTQEAERWLRVLRMHGHVARRCSSRVYGWAFDHELYRRGTWRDEVLEELAGEPAASLVEALIRPRHGRIARSRLISCHRRSLQPVLQAREVLDTRDDG